VPVHSAFKKRNRPSKRWVASVHGFLEIARVLVRFNHRKREPQLEQIVRLTILPSDESIVGSLDTVAAATF